MLHFFKFTFIDNNICLNFLCQEYHDNSDNKSQTSSDSEGGIQCTESSVVTKTAENDISNKPVDVLKAKDEESGNRDAIIRASHENVAKLIDT